MSDVVFHKTIADTWRDCEALAESRGQRITHLSIEDDARRLTVEPPEAEMCPCGECGGDLELKCTDCGTRHGS